MAIATLLLASFVLKLTGQTGLKGMTVAISMGTVICIVAAMAGDTSQDLKTGFIVGATPWKQQVGELIGAVVSGLAIGGVLYLLQAAWSFGDPELPAPQATLMKLVVEGVMGDYLPWGLILIGVFIAVAVEIVGIPVLPFLSDCICRFICQQRSWLAVCCARFMKGKRMRRMCRMESYFLPD